jgi:hypothetical protein
MKPTGMLSRKYLTGKIFLLLKKAEHCGQPSGDVVVLSGQTGNVTINIPQR